MGRFIRSFAASNREVFFTVALALTGSRHFFGDVESQLGVEPVDTLRDHIDELRRKPVGNE